MRSLPSKRFFEICFEVSNPSCSFAVCWQNQKGMGHAGLGLIWVTHAPWFRFIWKSDVATAPLKHHAEDDFAAGQSALIEGYRQQRRLDRTQFALFMALHAAAYVGWTISCAREDATGARHARFIDTA